MRSPPFLSAHAAHADWHQAVALCVAQLRQQSLAREAGAREAGDTAASAAWFQPYTLGFCYLTDHHAGAADAICAALSQHCPGVQWVGCVGVGVAASGVEHFDEPALALMLAALPRDSFRVFSGRHPLSEGGPGFRPHTALVHADGRTQDLGDLLAEMSERVATGYLFGGLASSRTRLLHIADDAIEGGLSGVAFTDAVRLVSRVTQGCQPVGPARRVTEAENNLVVSLEGESPLRCLVQDLGAAADEPLPRMAIRLSHTLVGLSEPGEDTLTRPGQFGADVRVRHLIGLEPNRGYLSVADHVRPGMLLTFCKRDPEAARRDLMRIATEIREVVESDADTGEAASRIAGAIYVSCSGRGGAHFGAPHAEMQIVRRGLGDVPVVGFFAGGEIARHHLYGYTGVLTAFLAPA